jgi:integrase
LLTIRLDDPEWIADPSPGRPSQLMLILRGDRLPSSQPLIRPLRGKAPDHNRPPAWLSRLRAAASEPADDPRVCPPTTRGQLLLFQPRRQLTNAQAWSIQDRDLPDFEPLREIVISHAADHGLSTQWWRVVCLMIRLALAIREADGDDLVREESLDDLPSFRDITARFLRGQGLLRPRRGSRPLVPHKPQRSCSHCDCWGYRSICTGCTPWKHQQELHPVGDCARCRRPAVPLLDDLCRACCLHIDQHGPEARTQTWTQLWLGGDLAPRLAMRTGTLGYVAPHQKARARAAARRRPPRPISPHLIAPGQGVLFDAPRDWSCFAKGTLDQLPSLTPAAQVLLDGFRHHADERGLDEQVRRIAARSLRILLAWLGAEAPIHEADIWALPADRPGTSARHVLGYLQQYGLVIPDPARQIDIHQRVIKQRLGELPAGIADELRSWVKVQRGEGRREHRAMPFETIRKYLGYMNPVLTTWAGRVSSLREITRDDIHNALKPRPGQPGLDLASALRSLFQALKQERLIFRDPTRGITMAAVVRLPVPIPTDRLCGLIDRADSAMAKLVLALVAIHGLGKTETSRLLLDDLDLQAGTLTIRRDLTRHTLYFDELTHSLAIAWLRERRRRWPRTANPHLLLSGQTAVMDTHPPISSMVMNDVFKPHGLSASKLRQDRILDEAKHTADPVHLMRVFGIGARTAMKYVYAAHPEKRSSLPR